MNAAAKVMHENQFFYSLGLDMRMSMQVVLQTVLLILVLFSALGVIYSTNLNRTALGQLEMAEQQAHQLEVQWGQLLLEQASLATLSRIEQLAVERLHMRLPDEKQTFVLRVQ